jgi:hypothetical protein
MPNHFTTNNLNNCIFATISYMCCYFATHVTVMQMIFNMSNCCANTYYEYSLNDIRLHFNLKRNGSSPINSL